MLRKRGTPCRARTRPSQRGYSTVQARAVATRTFSAAGGGWQTK
jgi:hypothetical protein